LALTGDAQLSGGTKSLTASLVELPFSPLSLLQSFSHSFIHRQSTRRKISLSDAV